MKLETTSVVALLTLLLGVCCPDDGQAKCFYGIKGGLSVSSPARSGAFYPGVEWSARTGLALAVQLGYPVAHQFALVAEPMIIQKGVHVDWPGTQLDGTAQDTDLDLPVSARFQHQLGSVAPFIFAGPYASVSLARTYVSDAGGTSETDDKSYDFGVVAGGGLKAPLREHLALVCDGRYAFGLINTSRSKYASIKQRAVVILVGLESER